MRLKYDQLAALCPILVQVYVAVVYGDNNLYDCFNGRSFNLSFSPAPYNILIVSTVFMPSHPSLKLLHCLSVEYRINYQL